MPILPALFRMVGQGFRHAASIKARARPILLQVQAIT